MIAGNISTRGRMETEKKSNNKAIVTCSRSERGVRERNEDACGIFSIPSPAGNLLLLAVADGLGGHPAGEVASTLAIRALFQSVSASADCREGEAMPPLREILATGFLHANAMVCRYSRENPSCRGMGTTLVAALLTGYGEGICGNIGDSRAYLVGRTIRRITRDHSEVQEMVDRGLIPAEVADHHPLKNIVTRIIGRLSDTPDFFPLSLGNECLLLCSDGLLDGISEEEIPDLVRTTRFSDLCDALVAGARSRSRDNITVVAAQRSGIQREEED